MKVLLINMMTKIKLGKQTLQMIIMVIGFHLFLVSCHHHPEVSEDLKKAHSIQRMGLDKINGIEKEISKLDLASVDDVQKTLKNLKVNMVEIEGLDHDHAHCDGNHTKPTYTISDKDMIGVQQVWLDSISILEDKLIFIKQKKN